VKVEDWTNWSPRGDGFAQVLACDDGRPVVAMDYCPPHATSEEWSTLASIWLDLPLHASALEALASLDHDRLALRYAALDWGREPVLLASSDQHIRFAEWGAQVTEYFELLAREVPHQHLPALLSPFVKIDIGEHARVGFHPIVLSKPQVAGLPPEAFGPKAT